MTYFRPRTIDDILEMKERGDAEGATLEYKSSRLFEQKNEKVFETLSKELTAFANAIGGALIIGVEEDNDRRISDIRPIQDPSRNETWLEDGLLSRIAPSLQISIERIDVEIGHLLVLDVPPSRNAPHQAADKRFYARRLFRIDPLLPFEVEDIRRRVSTLPSGASLSITFESGRVSFSIKNDGLGHVFDVSIQIEGIENTSIVQQWVPGGFDRPYTEPFRIIHSGETRNFLGAGFEFLQGHLDDRMDVHLHYTDEDGKQHQKTYTYYLKDFHSTYRMKSPNEEVLEQGIKRLENIERTLTSLSRDIKAMHENAFHPTGLNFSRTTLTALSNRADVKWPGRFLTIQALAEVLEIDIETALRIQRELFGASHYFGGANKPLEDIDLPDDIKERIRQRLILSG
ncbi:ATP-binding protein [Mesorhizobium sophorae]|uniref:ATP-binding protein n=1 Tax=Mesorhizobium sophorae TaxID=1300294 RepID=UPI000BA32647|nr:ATP-binding protein [Mesorhizobium sophorae]